MSDLHPLDASVPDDDNLIIEWSDGRTMVYPMDSLRAKCPCAHCVDEWTGEVKVSRGMFSGVTLRTLEEAGNYAFKIAFSDGHASGIYTWKLLAKIGTPLQGDAPASPFQV